jgi:hypothetical protein
VPAAAAPELVEPAHLWIPPRADSYGADVIDLARVCGLHLDEHQQLAIDAIQSVDDLGRWAAIENAVVEPRQNGKSAGILMPIAIAQAVFEPDQLIVWSAHRYKTSHEAFLAMLKLYSDEEHPEFRRRVAKVSYSNGEEAFEFHNGSRIVFIARSQASGRGLSGDLVILDEALFLTGAMMGALFPTLSARPNPMVLYASSAGLASSDVLRGLRDRGRAGGDPSLVYLEWCAPEGRCKSDDCDHAKTAVGCMLDDPAFWAVANPAVAAGRITLDYIAAERRALPVAEFMRERMGWWESPAVGGLFHMPDWWRAQDAETQPGEAIVLAAHITPDRSRSSVAIASMRGDGRLHVELIEHRDGVSWVVPYIVDRVERHGIATIRVAGPMAAGALVPDLEDVNGFKPLNATEVRRACARFFDAVKADGTLAVRPHSDLDAAVEAAAPSSDHGEWVFTAAADFDLSPLYAAALATYAAIGAVDYDLMSSFG